MERAGNWMQTYTGRRFWPLDPRPEDIDIVDIAHALAMTCRYGGHCKQFYSVAQHSVLVAGKAPAHLALRALLHDAPEALTGFGDVIRPMKKHVDAGFIEWVENIVERAICARFDLPFPLLTPEIKRLDNRILSDEREQVMAPLAATGPEWGNLYEPLGVVIEPWAPEVAREKFLNAFEEYGAWHAKCAAAVV
jgi:hypothetical protein